jgi:hypothetical protein
MARDERNAGKRAQRQQALEAARRIDRIMRERAMRGDRAFAEDIERRLRAGRFAQEPAGRSAGGRPPSRP